MEQAGPPVVIINEQDDIVHLSAAAGRFLTFSTGALTRNLRRAVNPDLGILLTAVLEHARFSQRSETTVVKAVHLGDGLQTVRVRVSPLGETWPGHLLVAIEAQPCETSLTPVCADDAETEQLRAQYDDLRARHAAALEQHRADTDELRATLEELAANREELQSFNEELTATNVTLQEKIVELGHVNSDLQNLVTATQIATVFLDRELRITRHTPAAATLFPLKPSDVGRPLTDLRHGLDYPELEDDAAQVLADLRPIEREVSGSGSEWFLVRLLPYRTVDNRIAGVSLTCVNITERRQAEAHRQAKEAAERINQARNEFLSRMSHELRTPLNAILGFGQILELSSYDEQDRTALALILKAGRHLLSLVDEVLDLTRAEGGELRLVFNAVDLGKFVRECLQLTARLAEARGVVCAVEEEGHWSLPPLWTDEQRLRQVLLNLLTNAIKYNQPGGTVTLNCQQVTDNRCRISVRDTGCGIMAEDLPRLFTPFERLHHAHGEVEGTGLGLAITSRLVDALGGSIAVESDPGQGSHFWVELPFGRAPSTRPANAVPSPPSISAAAIPRDRTLLCIEDNASNLQLIQMVAARHWPTWRFLTARDGTTGLEQARRHLPDVILLDLQLPDRLGDEVLAELRRDPHTAALPVVVLSADATARSRERLRVGGAAEFITKPFQINELVRAVNRTVQLAATTSEDLSPNASKGPKT